MTFYFNVLSHVGYIIKQINFFKYINVRFDDQISKLEDNYDKNRSKAVGKWAWNKNNNFIC